MPVAYERAREIVRQATAPDWPFGTFCLDDRTIAENDEMYTFSVGAREYLIDDNISFAVAGSTPVVYKEDGRLEWLPSAVVGTDPTIRVRPNPHPTLAV